MNSPVGTNRIILSVNSDSYNSHNGFFNGDIWEGRNYCEIVGRVKPIDRKRAYIVFRKKPNQLNVEYPETIIPYRGAIIKERHNVFLKGSYIMPNQRESYNFSLETTLKSDMERKKPSLGWMERALWLDLPWPSKGFKYI